MLEGWPGPMEDRRLLGKEAGRGQGRKDAGRRDPRASCGAPEGRGVRPYAHGRWPSAGAYSHLNEALRRSRGNPSHRL